MHTESHKRFIDRLLLFVPVLILSSCSHQLTRSQAADLIKSEPDWTKPITMTARIGGVAYAGSDMTFEKKLQSLGYVQVQGPLGFGNYYTYSVALTPQGDESIKSHGWTLAPTGEKAFLGGPAPAPTPQKLTIPVGTLHLLDVTGIVGDDKKATAEFTWQLDCNDTGKAVGCTSDNKSGKRTFTRYDDGWRIDAINK
jgi:hypothetical protein